MNAFRTPRLLIATATLLLVLSPGASALPDISTDVTSRVDLSGVLGSVSEARATATGAASGLTGDVKADAHATLDSATADVEAHSESAMDKAKGAVQGALAAIGGFFGGLAARIDLEAHA